MSVARYTPPYTLELAPRSGLSRESLRAVTSRHGEVGRPAGNRTQTDRLRGDYSSVELRAYRTGAAPRNLTLRAR